MRWYEDEEVLAMPSTSQGVRTMRDLTPGDHLGCLYETAPEHGAVLAPFLRQGLDQGEKVLCIVDAHAEESLRARLRDEGLGVEPYLASGQLRLLSAADACMQGGVLTPERAIALLRAETERAVAEGYAALRVAEEMTWAARG